MPLGECISENFKVIRNNPTDPDNELDLPKSSNSDCCFTLPVLAEIVVTSPYNNDKSSVIWFYDNAFSGAVMELEKYVSGAWTKVDDLDNTDNGTYYAYGFFTNDLNEKAMGYQIDWQKVLVLHGDGSYRVKTVETNIFGTTNKYSLEWCLRTYTPDRANGTIRFDWWLNGICGDSNNDQRIRDFGSLNWFNEIRLEGWFGLNSSEYEKNYVRYQNGQQVWIKDERTQNYACDIGRVPNYVHELLSGEVFQADYITVTDYNTENPTTHIDRAIKLTSSYEPNWYKFSKYAFVNLTFTNEYKNFVRKRC